MGGGLGGSSDVVTQHLPEPTSADGGRPQEMTPRHKALLQAPKPTPQLLRFSSEQARRLRTEQRSGETLCSPQRNTQETHHGGPWLSKLRMNEAAGKSRGAMTPVWEPRWQRDLYVIAQANAGVKEERAAGVWTMCQSSWGEGLVVKQERKLHHFLCHWDGSERQYDGTQVASYSEDSLKPMNVITLICMAYSS